MTMEHSNKSVLLLGATGLVGGECLKLLINDSAFNRIVVLTRSPLHALSQHIEHHQIDFESPPSFERYLGVDTVICALGTTIRKAGSREAFRRVDFDYPLMFAKLALKAGARHFLLVSSSGANPKSGIFYARVKGELEVELQKLEYSAVSIFRPSLLLGHRKELRLGEILSKAVSCPVNFMIPKSFRPIHAARVAEAIVREAREGQAGMSIVRNQDMLQS